MNLKLFKMKRFSLLAIIALVFATSLPASASEWDINNVLGNLKKAASADSTATQTSSSGSLGDLISGVANKLGIGSSSLELKDIVGTWTYNGPAVSFKSDNFLLKAGGAAAATQVEAKLEPYYRTAGFTSLVFTVNEDSTFTFKAKLMQLQGTIARDGDNFTLNFKALKTFSVGSMEAFIVMNGNKMELTFDVSKLMTLIEKVGKLSGNNTIKGVSAILNQYDGMTAGFELQRKTTN